MPDISSIDILAPANGTQASLGAGEIRAFKEALRGSFPNFTTSGSSIVTRTSAQLNNAPDKTATETITGSWLFNARVKLADGSATDVALGFNSNALLGLFKSSASNSLGVSADGLELQEAGTAQPVDIRIRDKAGNLLWTVRRRATASGNHLEIFRTVSGVAQAASIVFDYSTGAVTVAGLQPLDATLTALAALDAAAGVLTQTAADTFSKRALNSTGVGALPSTTILDLQAQDVRYQRSGLSACTFTEGPTPSISGSPQTLTALLGTPAASNVVGEGYAHAAGVLQVPAGTHEIELSALFLSVTSSVTIAVVLETSPDNSTWTAVSSTTHQLATAASATRQGARVFSTTGATQYVRALLAKTGGSGTLVVYNPVLSARRV